MLKFDSVEAVVKYIEGAVQEALAGEVTDIVKSTESKVIEQTVYDAYSPKMYKRRHDMGYPSNMSASVSELTLEVTNTTPPNEEGFDSESVLYPEKLTTNKDLSAVVEYGSGYDYWDTAFPRPFTQKTVEELASNKKVVYAIARALRARGIKVSIE